MYLIIKEGGKQLKIHPNETFYVEYLKNLKNGDEYQIKDVLAFFDGEKLHVGSPYLEINLVTSVMKHGKAKKVIVFKKTSKRPHKVKKGHRQPYTMLSVLRVIYKGKELDFKLPELPDKKTNTNQQNLVYRNKSNKTNKSIVDNTTIVKNTTVNK